MMTIIPIHLKLHATFVSSNNVALCKERRHCPGRVSFREGGGKGGEGGEEGGEGGSTPLVRGREHNGGSQQAFRRSVQVKK